MLRRRLAKDDDVQQTTDKTRDDKGTSSADTKIVVVQENPQSGSFFSRPKSKRRNGLIFALGGIFGIFVALFFANQQDVISLESLMDLNLDTLMDVIPQGIVRDAREFTVCWNLDTIASCYPSMLIGFRWNLYSNMSARQSAMIPSPSVSSFRRKVSRLSIRSL
jgi:phospholipid:diacylglycerol acyltransferase